MDIYVSKVSLGFVGFLVFVAIFLSIFLFYFWHSRRKNKYSPFTEDTLRLPGHSLRKKYTEALDSLVLNYLLFIFTALGLILGVLLLNGPLRIIVAVVCLIYLLYILANTWKLVEQILRYKLGLEGEEYTGQELNLLMLSGAYVFHDIPYQYGNIDHIVIGGDKIFTIETKAFRKSQGSNGSKDAKVVFDGAKLRFPDKDTIEPITQAKMHAEFLRKSIKNKCGVDFSVFAVVALPGWYVKSESKARNVLVMNPQRGKYLKPRLGEVKNRKDRDRVVNYVASVARSVTNSSNKSDPDASKKYDFWLNPRSKESSLD